MDDDKPPADELKIVDEEKITQRGIVNHRLWTSKIATILAVSVVIGYAFMGAVVLFMAFLHGQEPPNWATAVESSAVTAALAVVFKAHIPGG